MGHIVASDTGIESSSVILYILRKELKEFLAFIASSLSATDEN